MMTTHAEASQKAQQLLDFIDASPSPWHAVDSTIKRLESHGFKSLLETDSWSLQTGGRYYAVRGGSSIIAFSIGEETLATSGLRLVGAHTDSPGLRLKPKTAFTNNGLLQLAVEVYGGPILATFADRDLSLAGQVNVRTSQGFQTHLLKSDTALLRLPNLAIHMNREVNDKGLKFNKQTELPLILALAQAEISAESQFSKLLADQLRVESQDIFNWELNVYDTQKGSFWGIDQAFIADSQLDNLASCHAAISALVSAPNNRSTNICALFDHEEVGSESSQGANGSFLNDVIKRIFSQQQLDQQMRLQALANSLFISADMAHAYHPNFPSAYEPNHHVLVNQGPVIKTNCNQRYSTSANTAAQFMDLCERANVPYQQYAHRSDLGCGSTIGPMIAANSGIATVDVGNPMWAMHSVRESAGVLDHAYMIAALAQHFQA